MDNVDKLMLAQMFKTVMTAIKLCATDRNPTTKAELEAIEARTNDTLELWIADNRLSLIAEIRDPYNDKK